MENKQKLAENEHKKFVDLMHPFFGLKNRPDYCEVYFRSLFEMGILQYNPWRIAICDRYKLKEDRNKIIHTVWHESSHYLHYLKNPSIFKMDLPENEEERYKIIHLVEGIADLGALLMLKEEESLEYNQARKYHMEEDRLGEEHMLTWVITMRNPRLLESLIKNDVEKASELMNQHREEALIYVNSICRKGLEIPDNSFYEDE